MNAPAKVDVLGIIARDAELALSWNGRALKTSQAAFAESKEARATVAELIEATTPALRLLEKWAVQIDGEWGSCRELAELERDGRLDDEILTLRAAIARIGGAS